MPAGDQPAQGDFTPWTRQPRAVQASRLDAGAAQGAGTTADGAAPKTDNVSGVGGQLWRGPQIAARKRPRGAPESPEGPKTSMNRTENYAEFSSGTRNIYKWWR